MQTVSKKAVIAAAVCILALGALGFFLMSREKARTPVSPAVPEAVKTGTRTVIGSSVLGRAIEAYKYGNGATSLVFVGGIHGGYEWNSVLLAYELKHYLESEPAPVPENLTVIVIPNANPDGVYKVTGKIGQFAIADVSQDTDVLSSGRFNAHGVDLNRNFDCKWKPDGKWKGKTVSSGTEPFSEPETQALKDFLLEHKPRAVIFFHSQANAVYASECENGILPETLDIMNIYSKATGYRAINAFDSYEVTGDAEGWLASIEVPAITVELETHETIEWERNLPAIRALFEHYKQSANTTQ